MGKGLFELCSETETLDAGMQILPKSLKPILGSGTIVVSSNFATKHAQQKTEMVFSPVKPRETKPLLPNAQEEKSPFSVGANSLKFPPITVATSRGTFSDTDANYISIQDKLSRFPLIPSDENILPNNVNAKRQSILLPNWEEERKFLFDMMEFLFIAGGTFNKKPRAVPGGGGQSNGASNTGGGASSNSTNSTMWVINPTIGGGGGGNYGNYAGGSSGDDDDPWQYHPQIDLIPGHYLEKFDDYELDEKTEELLRGNLFDDLPLLDFPPNFEPLHYNRSSANIMLEEPSDPVPGTPIGPLSVMSTTSGHICSPAPVQQSSASVDHNSSRRNSDIKTLLEIQELMKNPPSIEQINHQPSTPTAPSIWLGPQNKISYQASTSRIHHVEISPVSPLPPQQQSSPAPLNFFKTDFLQDSTHHIIKVSVKSRHDHLPFQALQHCFSLMQKYISALQQPYNHSVAIQVKAELCSMTLDKDSAAIIFKMPVNCVTLDEWLNSDAGSDVSARQLIMQQIVNTLVVLFQGENDLCFWGSYNIYVAANKQVYLYIDFEKSLAVQKVCAQSMQSNPRVEDCRLLAELYHKILEPFLNDEGNIKISPQLRNIFSSFGQIVATPANCIHQMAMAARVLGQRRTCKIRVDVLIDLSAAPYTFLVYSMEHEPLSQSLAVLKPFLPTNVSPVWGVHHINWSLANVAEVSVRDSQAHLFMMPAFGPSVPGALYI